MIEITSIGNFKNTINFLNKDRSKIVFNILNKYGQIGKNELAKVTPVDTGKTANSWSYKVTKTRSGYNLEWRNSNKTVTGIPIVILLYYGHATGSGYYVEGQDFISPTLEPILKKIKESIDKEVIN